MDTVKDTVTDRRAKRMIAAYMEGAESGMLEVRGYGLTSTEREEAEKMAVAFYGPAERTAEVDAA